MSSAAVVIGLKGVGVWKHSHVFGQFYKVDNLCDFLFASLNNKTLPKRGLHIKEKKYSYGSKFFHLRVVPHC